VSVDLRFRLDGHEPVPSDPAGFFEQELPVAIERAAERLAPALAWLDLDPLTVDVDGEEWTLSVDGRVRIARGRATEGSRVELSTEQLVDLVTDQATFMGFFTQGTLVQPAGRLESLLDWWLVLRSVLDDRPIHTTEPLRFEAADGGELDLARSFRIDDDRAEMKHFLEEAGFLHLERVFGEDEMLALSDEMDRLAYDYEPDDGRSWWATTADGSERLVRMQGFDSISETTRAILADDRFLAIGRLPGDGHRFADYASALVKPIGVVQGISDVPWHKDCSLGRHSYDCCSLTVGISVTGADSRSGQLRVQAGSHRVLVWPAFVGRQEGLPEIDLPTATGDVTVHLSCTKHMSQPPVERERRVLYTGFRLPPSDPEAVADARQRLFRILQSIPEGVSQRPAVTA
jgi:hypothetical protein